jgi:hypothetical protein
MYKCMYVCISSCTHTETHTHTQICECVHIYTCTHMLYIYIYARTHACMYICSQFHPYVCMYVCMYTFMYVYMQPIQSTMPQICICIAHATCWIWDGHMCMRAHAYMRDNMRVNSHQLKLRLPGYPTYKHTTMSNSVHTSCYVQIIFKLWHKSTHTHTHVCTFTWDSLRYTGLSWYDTRVYIHIHKYIFMCEYVCVLKFFMYTHQYCSYS